MSDHNPQMCLDRFSQILEEMREMRREQSAENRNLWRAIAKQIEVTAEISKTVFNGLSDRTVNTEKGIDAIRAKLEADDKERIARQEKLDEDRIQSRRWIVGSIIGAAGVIVAGIALL